MSLMNAIPCPSCGTQLKLPSTRPNARFRCPNCQEVVSTAKPIRFKKRPHKPKPIAWALWVPLGVGLLGGTLWWAMSSPNSPPSVANNTASLSKPASDVVAIPTPPATPGDHPAFRRLNLLLRAFENGNERTAGQILDYESWFRKENPEDNRIWDLLPSSEQSQFQEWAHARLRLLIPLIHSKYDLDLGYPMEGALLLIRLSEDSGQWQIACKEVGTSWQLTSCEFLPDPKPESIPEENPLSANSKTPLEEQAAGVSDGVFVSTGDGGKILAGKIERVESSASLTPELRTQIHALIDLALAEQGLESRLARQELLAKVQLAVPELLNRLVDLPLNGTAEREEEIAALDGLLQRITFRRSSFPSRALDGNPENLLLRQQLAIAAWFPWWKQWRRRWGEWAQKAGIPEPDPRRRSRSG